MLTIAFLGILAGVILGGGSMLVHHLTVKHRLEDERDYWKERHEQNRH